MGKVSVKSATTVARIVTSGYDDRYLMTGMLTVEVCVGEGVLTLVGDSSRSIARELVECELMVEPVDESFLAREISRRIVVFGTARTLTGSGVDSCFCTCTEPLPNHGAIRGALAVCIKGKMDEMSDYGRKSAIQDAKRLTPHEWAFIRSELDKIEALIAGGITGGKPVAYDPVHPNAELLPGIRWDIAMDSVLEAERGMTP